MKHDTPLCTSHSFPLLSQRRGSESTMIAIVLELTCPLQNQHRGCQLQHFSIGYLYLRVDNTAVTYRHDTRRIATCSACTEFTSELPVANITRWYFATRIQGMIKQVGLAPLQAHVSSRHQLYSRQKVSPCPRHGHGWVCSRWQNLVISTPTFCQLQIHCQLGLL